MSGENRSVCDRGFNGKFPLESLYKVPTKSPLVSIRKSPLQTDKTVSEVLASSQFRSHKNRVRVVIKLEAL